MALNRQDVARAEEKFSEMIGILRTVLDAKLFEISLTQNQLDGLRTRYDGLKSELQALLP